MEVHTAPAAAKRTWTYLRAAFFMARKGVLSNKRRLFVTMHLLLTKRRNKAVADLLSRHHRHGGDRYGGYRGNDALRRRDYEFSCGNGPDPGSLSFSFSFSFSSRRRRHVYFPCLGAVMAEEEDVASPAPPVARIEYYAASPPPSSLAPGEDDAFSVRVSNYSSEDEGAGSEAVDDDAEEFIRRFYEQLRRQNQIALLPCYRQECAA